MKPASNSNDTPYDLKILGTLGRDSLDTRGSKDIDDISVRRLKLLGSAPYHELITKEGADLISCAAAHPARPLIPPDADPIAVTLGVHVKNSPDTEFLEIRPDAAEVYPPTHAAALLAWLAQSPFRAAQKRARAALILILALATALSPAFGDDGNDTDDDDERSMFDLRAVGS